MGIPPEGSRLPFPILWGESESPPAALKPSIVDVPKDEEILARLGSGDLTVLNQLLDRYSRLVLDIAHRILHDYGEAEEIVQDVFFQIYQKAALFDPSRGSAKGWIVQIAFHRALDRRSYLNRRGFYVSTDFEHLDDVLSGETDLDRDLGIKLNRIHLEKAFHELPDLQRRTLELFFFEGLEIREIIVRLNEPLGNVRHYFYRGLERLRKSVLVQKLRDK